MNKLRLAARALIEWRTPPGAQLYQLVLADLARHHAARELMHHAERVFRLDEDGILLWYLSETLDAESSDYTRNGPPSPQLVADAYAALVIESVVEKGAARQVWPRGPRKDRVADAIRSAVSATGDEQLRETGVRSLVALRVPWPQAHLENCIRSLLSQGKTLSRLVQRLNVVVRSSLVVSQTIAGAGLVVALLSITVNNSSLQMSVTTGGIAITALAVLRVFGTKFKGTLAETALKGTALILQRHRELESAPDVLHVSSQFCCRALALPCGQIPGVLASMLRHPDADWGRLAFSCTKKATPQVIRGVLHILRLPETGRARRAEIFRWLCEVEVLEGEPLAVVSR